MSVFFDFIMFVIFAVFAYMGARRGVIREVFRFLAMVGGFFAAFLYYGSLQGLMKGFSSNQYVTAAAAFLIIFIIVFLAVTGIGLLLRKLTNMNALGGGLDGLFGLVLGLFKAALIAWVACLSISSMPFEKVQNEFGRSSVYKTYCALPQWMSLAGLENKKNSILGKKSAPKNEINDVNDFMKNPSPDESGKPDAKKEKPGKKDGKKQSKPNGKAAGTDV